METTPARPLRRARASSLVAAVSRTARACWCLPTVRKAARNKCRPPIQCTCLRVREISAENRFSAPPSLLTLFAFWWRSVNMSPEALVFHVLSFCYKRKTFLSNGASETDHHPYTKCHAYMTVKIGDKVERFFLCSRDLHLELSRNFYLVAFCCSSRATNCFVMGLADIQGIGFVKSLSFGSCSLLGENYQSDQSLRGADFLVTRGQLCQNGVHPVVSNTM